MGPPSYSCGGTSVPTWDPPGRRCCNIVALQVLGSSQRGVGWAVGRPGSVRLGGGVDRDRGRRPANATPGPERCAREEGAQHRFRQGCRRVLLSGPPWNNRRPTGKADRGAEITDGPSLARPVRPPFLFSRARSFTSLAFARLGLSAVQTLPSGPCAHYPLPLFSPEFQTGEGGRGRETAAGGGPDKRDTLRSSAPGRPSQAVFAGAEANT